MTMLQNCNVFNNRIHSNNSTTLSWKATTTVNRIFLYCSKKQSVRISTNASHQSGFAHMIWFSMNYFSNTMEPTIYQLRKLQGRSEAFLILQLRVRDFTAHILVDSLKKKRLTFAGKSVATTCSIKMTWSRLRISSCLIPTRIARVY